MRISAYVLLVAALSVSLVTPSFSQAPPAAAPRTSDDPRRVPLPPRDDSAAPVVVIRNGTLIDGKRATPVQNAVVVLRGDHVVAAGAAKDVTVPATVAREIDAAGLFVMPGMIDLHMHLDQQRGEDAGRYRDSDAAAAIRATLLAKQLIDVGITSIRSPGSRNDVLVRVKEAIQRGFITGPRVFWSGQMIISRAGHGDEITGTGTGRAKSLESVGRYRMATGPWDYRLAVREQIRQEVDWIKLTAPFTREEAEAAIDEAHEHGFRVTVDSFGKYTQMASEVGIDCIEHPLDLSREIIAVMARNKTDLVPTMVTFYNVQTTGYPSAGIPPGGFFYTMSRRFPVDHKLHLQSVRWAHEAGLRIGVGTDVPVDVEKRYPVSYYMELGFLKDAGFSDAQVLAAATRVNAEILGMEDKLGTLEPGKLADVLIVGGNPLADIQNVRDVRYVIAGGNVIRAPAP